MPKKTKSIVNGADYGVTKGSSTPTGEAVIRVSLGVQVPISLKAAVEEYVKAHPEEYGTVTHMVTVLLCEKLGIDINSLGIDFQSRNEPPELKAAREDAINYHERYIDGLTKLIPDVSPANLGRLVADISAHRTRINELKIPGTKTTTGDGPVVNS